MFSTSQQQHFETGSIWRAEFYPLFTKGDWHHPNQVVGKDCNLATNVLEVADHHFLSWNGYCHSQQRSGWAIGSHDEIAGTELEFAFLGRSATDS